MSHIVQVIPTIDRIGGAEREVTLLARGLAHRGWRSTVIALSGDGGAAAQQLKSAGAEFLSLGMRKGLADPRGWLRMHRWLVLASPHVLHAHLPHALWMTRLSRLLAPVRVVVDTLHTPSTGSATRRALCRATAALSDCVSVVSRSVAEAAVSARLIPASRVLIIPNGIDSGVWRPDPESGARLRAEMGIADHFLWVSVGRLEPVKDHATLLAAFAGLPQRAQLVIAGSGSLEPELRRLSSILGIDARVKFLGFTSDVLPWMQAADACVLASRWEGLPMCLLEAAACALPCVATDVTGSNEVVVNGATGFLALPGDAHSLARAMLRLMQMAPANRRAMGINAQQRIVERFSLESVLDRWEQLYADLLSERPLPTRNGHSFKNEQVSGLNKSCAGSSARSE
jgi:glycosyltransferase involved in cell wall biosynthesis